MGRITPVGFCRMRTRGRFSCRSRLPPGASVNRTEAAADTLVTQLQQMPQVAHVMSVIGFSVLDGASEANTAFFLVRLKPFNAPARGCE